MLTCHMRRCLCQLTPLYLELRELPTRGVPRETSSEVGLPARSARPPRLPARPPRAPDTEADLAAACSSSPNEALPFICSAPTR